MKPRTGAWVVSSAAWVAMVGLASCRRRRGPAAADPPVPAPSATAKEAIEPAAPLVPAEVVAAMQGGQYDAAIRSLVDAGRKGEGRRRSSVLRLSPGDRRAALGPARRGAADPAQRDAGRSPRAVGPPRSGSSWPGSSWPPATGPPPRSWPAPRPPGSWPATARTSSPRFTTPSHAGCSSPAIRWFDPTPTPPTSCWPRPASWPRARPSAPSSSSPWAAPAWPSPTWARAIENFQQYLKEYPQGADRFAVRLQLGEAQRKTNQLLPARLTWTDLARDIERSKPAELPEDLAAIRADALYEIASTYGIPNPPDDTSLNQGVAALRRFLAAFPAHPKAVRAAYLDRRVVSGPRQEHRGTRGLHPVPQGGRIPGRDRSSPARLGRARR